MSSSSRIDRVGKGIADQLDDHERRLKGVETQPQLAYSSIEDGSLDSYDQEGNLTAVIGKQHDGTPGVSVVTGPKTPAPVAPQLTPIQGGITARWSGKFADGALSPMNFSYVSLHCTDDPLQAGAMDTKTLRATMRGELGDEFALTHLDHTKLYYVWLIAWNTAGKPSDPSEVTTATPDKSVTALELEAAEQRIQEAQQEFEREAGNLAGEISTARGELESAQGRLSTAESEIEAAFGKASTAEAAATAAQTKADTAVSEAASAFEKAEAAESAAAAATGAAGEAEAAADAAAGKAQSALSAAQAASGDATAAQTAANTAKDAAAAAKTAAEAAGTAAAAADAVAAQAAADAAQAIADAAAAKSAATAADGKAAAAATAASTAQGTADAAKTAAATASSAAADAAGIAAGKGKVLVQSTAPAAEDRNAQTLWIDTTGGNNTPKRWVSGTTWSAVTDKKATDAATAAANAASAASAAQTKANEAHTLAGTAASNATAAMTAASGAQGTADNLPKVLHGVGAPAGVAPDGSIWWQHEGSLKGKVTAQWNRVAGKWESTPIDSQAIANLDVGKLTVGSGEIVDLVAQKIAGATANFQTADIKNLFVTEGANLNTVTAQRIASNVGAFLRLYAENIIAGEGGNLIPNGAGEKGDTTGFPSVLIYDTEDKPQGLRASFRTVPAQATVNNNSGPQFAVEPSTEYVFEVWLKADKPDSRFFFELRDQDGAHGTTNTKLDDEFGAAAGAYPVSNAVVPTTWTKFTALAKTTATANRLRVGSLYFNHPNGTEKGATVWIAGASLRRRVTGTIVATNSITAPKIVGSEEMWTKVLGTHKVNADEIDVGAIRAQHIGLGEVRPDALSIGIEESVPNPKWVHEEYDALYGPDKVYTDDQFKNLDTAGWRWDTNPVNLRFGQKKQLIVWGTEASKNWTKMPVSDYIPTQGGDRWYISADFFKGGPGVSDPPDWYLAFFPIWYKADGTRITTGESVSSRHTGVDNRIWGSHENIVTAPAGAVKFRLVVEKSNSNTHSYIMIGAMSCRRVMQGASASGRYAELSPLGVRLYDEDGAEVVSLTSLPPNYLAIKSTSGETLAGMNDEGVISGTGLNISDDPEIMGTPLIGPGLLDFDTPASDAPEGLLEALPRGLIARGYQSQASLTVTDGEAAFAEMTFTIQPGRMYQIIVEPIGVYISPGVYAYLNIRQEVGTNPGTPKFSSNLVRRFAQRAANHGSGSNGIFNMGGSIYHYFDDSATKARLLFSLESNGTATVFGNSSGGSLRVFVLDVGPKAEDVLVNRTDKAEVGKTPVAPTPPAEKKSYTKTYKASGYRSFYTSGGFYNYSTSKMFQGSSPAAGGLQSIATFPSMTGDLNGATITSIRVYIYFEHWYYNSGGTAQIGLHGASSIPSTKPSITQVTSSSKWPKPGGRWVKIPSQYWAGFKSGSYRGISLGDTSPSLTEYGYAKGSSTKIEIKYTK